MLKVSSGRAIGLVLKSFESKKKTFTIFDWENNFGLVRIN